MEEKPCCPEAAARMTKRLAIEGIPVGLAKLDEVMTEVKRLKLPGDSEIGEALLKKIKIFNYVPSSASSEYKRALLDEYNRRD
jgi:hypothetical protein